MTVEQLIRLLSDEDPKANICIQVSYSTGYIESNKVVDLDANSEGEIVLSGMCTYSEDSYDV